MDIQKIVQEFTEFIMSKHDLNDKMSKSLLDKSLSKQQLKEMLVENAVDDVYLFGKIRNTIGIDPSEPLTDKVREGMKKDLLSQLE